MQRTIIYNEDGYVYLTACSWLVEGGHRLWLFCYCGLNSSDSVLSTWLSGFAAVSWIN